MKSVPRLIENISKRLFLFLLILGLPAGILVSCSQPAGLEPAPESSTAPITIKDGLNRQIQLPGPAERVVSLAPALTEILFAIGAGDQVVGRDSFSDYPIEAKSIPDIGGGFGDLNLELILAQKPDLVLASELTPIEQIKSLQDLGIIVFALPNPVDFPGLFEGIQTIASLTGREVQAKTIIEALEARVQKIVAENGRIETRPLIFYEIDGTDPNAPWTPGPGSFVHMLIQEAGGDNLGARLDSEWAQISIEEIIAQDPDIILLGDATWGGVTPEDVRLRPGWDALKAVQNGSLFIFDDNLVSRPGPRLVDGLEGLARLFHPEVFQ